MNIKRISNFDLFEKAHEIRKIVFVEEQNVDPKEEFDEYETSSDHVLVYDGKVPVGTGRLRILDDTAKLERICVLEKYRKKGFGEDIVKALEEIAKERGIKKGKLNAQTHAENFYEKLGYKRTSNVFMEAGIPHVTMTKKL
ncbi:GNAT family N-acetyltransferase [Serpentinicella sp. ANB-PHB4]|uniref:GNAT family N-acetyltransferase n=1 Tax=Serpentinicella sp. ANB-PHB4 TaxID=3074076 RepID=UPI00286044B4|nr:GNAT family N-acetyltransferase [Serpentinicella sp. ANB-PHB4]MDR5659651.1 GNAT family N-acetyltransferase [Serpentinicella sp. ANB-PHB4]